MHRLSKLMVALLIICLVASTLIFACGGDEEEETPTATISSKPEPSPTSEATSTGAPVTTPALSPTEKPAEPVKITIGSISDLTGPAAQAMTVVDMALADLVRYFNEQNLIPGAVLTVETYDGQYDPSNDLPGYQYLKERGADVIFTGLPSVPISLSDRLAEDQMILFSCTAQEEFVDPPGWVFCLNITNPQFMYTLMHWIEENDPDFPQDRPAKVGGIGAEGPYMSALLTGLEDYANAHTDRWQFVDGFVVGWTVVTFGPQVEALKDCDYVLPPSTGFAIPNFMKEYRSAGNTGKFIGTDAHPSYLGMMAEGAGWDTFDGMLFALPNRWWTEDAEVPNLANQLLSEYHSASEIEQIKWAGISYIGSFSMWYAALNVLAEAINSVGPENFDSQALYDTATHFSMAFGGCEEWGYSETDRTSWNYLGIYEASAEAQDLVRKDPAWIPVRKAP